MTRDFYPNQRVIVTSEDGVWKVAMYAEGQSVGLIRESDSRELELGDDEFDQIEEAQR